ncbi:hypothetical protein QFC22_000806 [Naganishia vaughanmartiniae]|uniref:Uncharacterized protein n=1 Tax=Naganishia vaughanmartiniae TaxID=1424756 RepID=A0ACC2XJ18_9TREE|nr:hypothetical protein QFC22_000806 [Naganishia vaughanmartiniae]
MSWNNPQYPQRSASGGYSAPGVGGSNPSATAADSRYSGNYHPQAILQSSYAQQGYNPGSYDGYSNNDYPSNSHYSGHNNYYPNDPAFNGQALTGSNAGASTGSPGARSGQGVVDPSAPEAFPPASISPAGARQMSHEISGSHNNYDAYYSSGAGGGNYGNYDSYSGQYGHDAPQSASSASWNLAQQQQQQQQQHHQQQPPQQQPKVPTSAPPHAPNGHSYQSYQNSGYNPGSQQYSNYNYSNGPQSAQPYYNQATYLSSNPPSASHSSWQSQSQWSGGVNPQAMSNYSSAYGRGTPPQPQALAAAAQAASQYPTSHGKSGAAQMYPQGTMPPQAAQTGIAPQQTTHVPPQTLAPVPTPAINTSMAATMEYTGLGKRPAEDLTPAAVAAPTGKKTKVVKEPKEKIVPVEPPAPSKSHLKPPRQSHSAWQLFFTDQLAEAKLKALPGQKLNVAHVAKDAGELYKTIPAELKLHYTSRAEEARVEYHKRLDEWRLTLTPEDIKQENLFRAGQRKAGKSRKGNMKDTNAPKKPLSAYFLFLKAIRTSDELTKRVFEGEGETTKQSMMAAKKWRSFDDDQKRASLSQG